MSSSSPSSPLAKISPSYQQVLAEFREIFSVAFSSGPSQHDMCHSIQTHGPPISTPACHLEPEKYADTNPFGEDGGGRDHELWSSPSTWYQSRMAHGGRVVTFAGSITQIFQQMVTKRTSMYFKQHNPSAKLQAKVWQTSEKCIGNFLVWDLMTNIFRI